MKRVVLTGGGTGGHIMPGISLAECLASRGVEVLWIGSEGGMEREIVTKRGIRYEDSGMKRVSSGLFRGPRRAVMALAALPSARSKLRAFAADAVIGLGGYASVPTLLAARFCRIPYFLLEQNAIPGKVSRWFAPKAKRVYSQFVEARNYFAKRVVFEHTGSPVRREIIEHLRGASAQDPGKGDVVLVLGGSQGSKSVNKIFRESLPSLELEFPGLRVHHVAGAQDYDETVAAYSGRVGHKVYSFCNEMHVLLSEATVAVARAGAVTLAELAIAGIPAVLIPYPYAADNHQAANAEVYRRAGAAKVIGPSEFNATKLITSMRELLHDPVAREKAIAAMKSFGRPNAAEDIVNSVFCSLQQDRKD
ncbi:MAG: undecaprenyldiphospho-muramoylpentapeptide beta-N-acetylglucosaminyltransferase [Planctomycetota bacterium]